MKMDLHNSADTALQDTGSIRRQRHYNNILDHIKVRSLVLLHDMGQT